MTAQPWRRSWPCSLAEHYHAEGNHAQAIALLKMALELPRPLIGSIDYECPFFNGLTLVTTGAGTNITVIYE